MFLGFKVSICLMTLSFYNLTVKQCRHTNKTWKIQTSLQMRGQKKWPEQKKIKFSSENIKYDTRNYAISINDQKQPSRGVLKKRCCENMQQIYRRTPMPNCDFNKVAKLILNDPLKWTVRFTQSDLCPVSIGCFVVLQTV